MARATPSAIAAAATVGKTVKWVYPTDAIVQGTPYVLAINKTAPHPAAARLREEYMFSQVNGKKAKSLGAGDWKNRWFGQPDAAWT